MKNYLTLFTLLIFNSLVFSQRIPNITFVSGSEILGTANYKSIIYIDINNDDKEDIIIPAVDKSKLFHHEFNNLLKVNEINVWAEYTTEDGMTSFSDKKKYKVQTEKEIIKDIISKSKEDFKNESQLLAIERLDDENFSLRNSTLTYTATIWNTFFQLPLARFDLSKKSDNREGNISLFNSVGAGFGISWGRLERARNDYGQIIKEDFSSTFGLHLGVLFSASSGDDTKNVFAPTFNISLLDFQLGTGYELGTRTDNQRPFFFTVSYAIPLYKLIKKSYRIRKLSPNPISSERGSSI